MDERQIKVVEERDLKEIGTLSPEGWGDISYSFENYLRWDFAHPFKIMRGSQIAALGCLILHETSAWIAHIIVKEEYRKQGLGGVMVKDLLDLSQGYDRRSVSLIATDLGRPVYEKQGFRPQSTYICLQGNAGNGFKEKDCPYIVSLNDADLPELLRLDEELSGEKRGKLILAHLDGALVYKKEGCISGMYLPALGQGLILAKYGDAGNSLLERAMEHRDLFCFPEENMEAVAFLKDRGFEQLHTATRMTWGIPCDVKLRHIYGRIGGNLG